MIDITMLSDTGDVRSRLRSKPLNDRYRLIETLSNLGTAGAVEVEGWNEDLDCDPNS